MFARSCAALALSFVILIAGAAAAQDAKGGSVLAYDEAQKLMAEGKIGEACPKYAESQRLDPQLGTLFHLADCLEKNGQTASAWASFREAVDIAKKLGDPRKELGERHIAALVPKLSRLQINVAEGAEIHVERDAVTVGKALFGAPVPMDPGPHTITASAPGKRTWTSKIVIPADGSITMVTVPELTAEVSTSPESSETSLAPTARPTTAAGHTQSERSGLKRRWPAIAAAGVGLTGVAVGSVFGLRSMSKHDAVEEHCGASTCRDQTGVDLSDEAIAAGNISTIGFIVGGVGLAAGAVLWFTLPSGPNEEGARLDVGISRGSATVRGAF